MIPFVVVALGAFPKILQENLLEIGIPEIRLFELQNTTVFERVSIIPADMGNA